MSETEALRALVERIMTQHWDLGACPCWVCEEGRAAGCRPREIYQAFKHEEQRREPVRVGSEWVFARPKPREGDHGPTDDRSQRRGGHGQAGRVRGAVG